MQLPPLSAYVHIPWCERKCPYCDFNSHVRDALPETAYISALLADLREELRDERRELQSVYIGGGTPSLFSTAAIGELLAGLGELIDLAADVEITMEANPGSIESSRLAGYAQAGVTRFSIGVQSFDDDSLRHLGRIHDSHTASSAASAAAASGAHSYNLDLMHGLPQQSLDSGLADLHTALALAPPHLSWYQLTIEANTQFYNDPPRLPSESVLASLEARGAALLEAAGYHRYEVSAWARDGAECRHNKNYWTFGDYVAAGAGAHGKLTRGDGTIFRYAKTRQPEDYLRPGGNRQCSLRELDAGDRRGEFMLGALRLERGFSLNLFEERTGLDRDAIADTLAVLADDGLLTLEENQVAASDRGRRFLDDVIGRFFLA